MKIIVPVDENKVDVCPSFGRTPLFMLYDVDSQTSSYIVNEAADAEGGAGVKAAQVVVDSEADVLLTIRCGENANEVFKAAGIKVYKTISNIAKENVELYLNNKLEELTKFHAGYHGIR